ncbi:monocarboxylate transporter 2-like [Liolophura sinensis]|uniref:monocarboxylate transporter 2-like n=1 Tax=Liolophura sinensis TaxID=3198878 RepID=UPI003158F9F0
MTVRFTERTVLLFGSLIFSLGLILSYFAPNLEFHVLTLGLMTGIGMTSTSIPSQIAVGKYFDRYRSLANSICFCGSSLGVMSLPPLVMYLIHQYGLRGSFLIYGGLLLNCAVGGALVRPFKGANSKGEASDSNGADDRESGRLMVLSTTEGLRVQSNGANAEAAGLSPAQGVASVENTGSSNDQDVPGALSLGSVPHDSSSGKDHGLTLHALKWTNLQKSSKEEVPSQTYESLSNSTEKGIAKGSAPSSLEAGSREQKNNHHESEFSDVAHDDSAELMCSDIADQALYDSYASLQCIDGSMHLSLGRRCPDAKKEKSRQSKSKLFFAFRYFIDFSLFRNTRYMLFLFSTSLSMVGFVNVTIYLIPRAEEYGISRDKAALFLTIAGGCDIFGRLIQGLISDVKKIGPDRVMMTGLCLMGIATLLLPLAHTFNTMTAYMVIFGLIGSSGHILSLPIVMKFVEEERMPRAMGLVVSSHGISNIVSPPLLGFIKDKTGTYDSTLYVCGACQLIASGLMLLESLLRVKENCGNPPKRQEER